MSALSPRLSRGFVCLLALALSGCGRGTIEQQLVGRWQGRPETSEQRVERSPAAKQASESATSTADAPPVAENTDQKQAAELAVASGEPDGGDLTDLEQLRVEVTLELAADHSLVMSLVTGIGGSPASDNPPDADPPIGAQQRQTGTWRVLNAEGDRAQIEIVASREGDKSVQRRFELQMLDDGQAMTLREQDADPRFGRLYFDRVQ